MCFAERAAALRWAHSRAARVGLAGLPVAAGRPCAPRPALYLDERRPRRLWGRRRRLGCRSTPIFK
jgi:hypothetical protein